MNSESQEPEEAVTDDSGSDRSRMIGTMVVVIFGLLLVACVIIGPMAIFLLGARDKARRTTCMEHMRMIGVQMDEYYQAHERFPPGWIMMEGVTETSPAWGWPAHLISMTNAPYPTEGDLDVPLVSVLTAEDQRLELLQSIFEEYICPADDAYAFDGTNHPDRRWTHKGKKVPFGLSMYVGNAGHKVDAVGSEPNTGILYGNSEVTLDDIPDGISYTVMVGERDLTRCRAGSWPGVPNPMLHDGGPSIWNVAANAKPKINAPAWDGDTLCGEGYSSFHPGGVNMLMVDGSVKFFADDTDSHWSAEENSGSIGVLQQMMIRNDGEAPIE
ncbi:DUF1559 domain-containing protein [bacterium]|nr:DUF1559 domain-containing protein [bacterium]